MTVRTIQTHTDTDVPPLKLPPAALSKTDHQYHYDPDIDKPAIEPIEHKIRLDIMRAGYSEEFGLLKNTKRSHPWEARYGNSNLPLFVRYVENSLFLQRDSEVEFYSVDSADDSLLQDAPEYLANQIEGSFEKGKGNWAGIDELLKQVRKDRTNWYDNLIMMNINTVFQEESIGELMEAGYDPQNNQLRNRSIHGLNGDQVTYTGVLVIDPEDDKDVWADKLNTSREFIRHAIPEDFSGSASENTFPADYGIEHPAPLIMGTYPGGSEYLMIPHSSGLVCQGPYKQNAPHRVICKHEAVSALILSEVNRLFLPVHVGIDVPARARRFIDPKIARTHESGPFTRV